MRFVLIDRILDVQPGRSRLAGPNTFSSPSPSLVAVKNLSLTEEYLSDHFPGFPVMPGVLMLEALDSSRCMVDTRHGGFRAQHYPAQAGEDDQVWQLRGTGPAARAACGNGVQ